MIWTDIRQKIWNQNLVSVVIQLEGEKRKGISGKKTGKDPQPNIPKQGAKPDGPFSALDVASPSLFEDDCLNGLTSRNAWIANCSQTFLPPSGELSQSGFYGTSNQRERRLYAELY